MPRRFSLMLGFLIAATLTGCKKAPPPIVAVSGVVLLNGQPLDKAEVRFYPMHPDLDGSFMGSAVTDDTGAFTLMTQGKPGACACEHKIVVCEGPFPKDTRGESARAQMAMGEYMMTLKNRPIPETYTNLPDTPLAMTITAAVADVKLELKR
jgi:hypothetical protein